MNKPLFKAALDRAGISQAEVARRMGISPKALSQKVVGHKRFWLNEVISICKILSIEDPKEIFFDHDKRGML